jgi:hypothetical protein
MKNLDMEALLLLHFKTQGLFLHIPRINLGILYEQLGGVKQTLAIKIHKYYY